MVFINAQRNKSLAEIKENCTLDGRSYCDILTCYKLLYGMPGRGYPYSMPGRGYPYSILYRVIYSTGNLGTQMIVIVTPPPPPLQFSRERNPGNSSSSSSSSIFIYTRNRIILHGLPRNRV